MSTNAIFTSTPPITRRVRAYFAPVNRAAAQPTIFDPSLSGGFDLDAPPSPWIDLGWIENFTRKTASKITPLNLGSPGMAQVQVRDVVGATVACRFKTWGKLSMALAAASEHMNLIIPAANGTANGSGSKGIAAVSLQSGSTATFLAMTATDAATFAPGALVAIDEDYTGQTGFVGSGVSAAYVQSSASVNNDPDYLRRVTFNVARVASVSSSGLQLSQPLIAGAPAAGMKVQTLAGFVDREGGSFFQEWSALFVMPGEQGERICFHYPRLQAMAGPQEMVEKLLLPVERVALDAAFRALPVTDSNDGQQVVCFRSFLPAAAMPA